jgi:hypothetical protein
MESPLNRYRADDSYRVTANVYGGSVPAVWMGAMNGLKYSILLRCWLRSAARDRADDPFEPRRLGGALLDRRLA